jgi:glycogen debranching enzyme
MSDPQVRANDTLTPQQHRSRERALTQSHASRMSVGTEPIVLKRDATFFLCDERGDVAADSGQGLGLFRDDTRFLSLYQLTWNGRLPVALSTEHGWGEWTSHDLENEDLPSIDGGEPVAAHTIALRRDRTVEGGAVRELLTFTNFGMRPAAIRVRLCFEADFAPLLGIRGTAHRTAPTELCIKVQSAEVSLSATGATGGIAEQALRAGILVR